MSNINAISTSSGNISDYSLDPDEEKHKILIENSLSAFFITIPGKNGCIVESNEAASSLFGYTADEFKVIRREDILDYTDSNFQEALQHRNKNGFLKTITTGIKKNGDPFPVEIFSAIFINAQGEQRTSTLITNLSEQKKSAWELKQVLASITDGFFSVDFNWTVKYWNKEVEKISGIKKEEITGKNFWDFYNGTKKNLSYFKYNKALENKISVHFEEFYEPANVWLEINIYPSETGFSIFFKDVTETKRLTELERIEKEFLESTAAYNSKIENNLSHYLKEIEKIHPGMVCSVLKLNGNCLYNWAGPSLPKEYSNAIEGITIGENIGSCGTAAFKKQKIIVADIENDIRWADYKAYALNAGLRSCWSFPIINSKNQVLGTFAIYYKEIKIPTKEEEKTIERAKNILTIILENKISKELLKASEESYRYLFNNNPSSIIIWDIHDLKIIEVNEAAEQLYGYPREEFLSLAIPDIHPKEESIFFLELFQEVKDDSFTKKTLQRHHKTKTGNSIVLEISSHIINYNGKKAVLTLGNDITEKIKLESSLVEVRKLREQQITDAVIMGQEKERIEIGEELHENINQIVATIKLYLEFTLIQNKLNPELITESKLLTERVMVAIKKLTNALMPPALEEIGLLQALNDLVDSLKLVNAFTIETKWKNFNEDLLNKKIKLTIFRIVQEQLNNIIKHANASKVEISIASKGDEIYLSIKDDGVGFDTAKKRTGVGLKNIKSRSEVSNGKISIESKKGKGCAITVIFTLP
jgi:PAS domain S-box-containing protein